MISLSLIFKVTSQVADELVAENSDPGSSLTDPNQVRLTRIMKLSRGKHISDLNQQAYSNALLCYSASNKMMTRTSEEGSMMP